MAGLNGRYNGWIAGPGLAAAIEQIALVCIANGGGGGGGGSSTYLGLTDAVTVDLPTINTPLATALAGKQATLQSGVNIRTVNGQTLLGTTDLAISGSGVTTFAALTDKDTATIPTTNIPLSNALAAKAPLNSPALVTPNLGVPSAGNLAACTGYTAANLAGLGSGVATFLGTPSSSNFFAAISDETGGSGSGKVVGSNGPTIDVPIFTNLVTHAGADLIAGTAVASNVISFGAGKNTQSLTGNVTVTFGGSPVTDQMTSWAVVTDGSARTVTLPANVRSVAQQAVVGSIVFPANWQGYISFVKTSTGYDMIGEPIALKNLAWSGVFGTGANDTKTICVYAPFAGTLKNFITQSISGTATYTLQINGVAVTGGANSVSSTLVNNALTSANTVAIGDKIQIVRSADASCVNASFSILIAPNGY